MYSKTLSYLDEIKRLEKHQEHMSWLYLKTNNDVYLRIFNYIDTEIEQLHNYIKNIKKDKNHD